MLQDARSLRRSPGAAWPVEQIVTSVVFLRYLAEPERVFREFAAMTLHARLMLATAFCFVLVGPAAAAGITGAGSGSTGGTMTGAGTQNGSGLKTGADNGDEAVPSKQDRTGVGTGDNAVLNAPREAVPGSKPGSQPSNLNGASPAP
ncbi:hypothetical protein P7D22_23310 [Lichenihabitans sp. Uapishka_5]|uniref:hypothetical protein n=1 Tax=Lichenihabitans sp. Uapishka_5 TaxID=3037302 RepID=UPI0029E7CF5A|nr:hypothetical protein [Lichenihabitans sp. Uapishka_5]MDX7954070.1 hypothetical protein [Lichenihabitans sp. Uapishka_5]